ncbi:hypothetical protein A2841_02075 [Candidatus Kaiserbacteria bacterium RIFCSPHIGHO2_01_FULL_48_10]|uniref:LysM domain-containing protein n=1 Tax=Candidatus Kaiserbacteria bacterium RIFCSPHIGHO2_01_FULL_48_10 TaxID=1798476 RepID=A0A1F6C4F7_9BACT|nr:MAG: hypothetical protein A2841_02075 [Candidatus Kaiserbacteria bacterium RIFCSPHIGHO2_01_FULL_48_10]
MQAFSFFQTAKDALGSVADAASYFSIPSSKTPVLQAAVNLDPTGRGGGDITIVGEVALLPEAGPEGTTADIIQKPTSDQISLYVVRDGDSLSQISKMFGVSVNTIMWGNDIKRATDIHPGDTLLILPVTGVKYTVAKGDTLAKIAKRFKGDAEDISRFNNLSDPLAVGTELIIPNGEIAAAPAVSSGATAPSRPLPPAGTPQQVGYYLRPVLTGIHTQGIHGYNGIDIGAAPGTPILASAEGDVIVAKNSGWNGGYANYAVIKHDNGSQTLYAHATKIIVSVGQHVVQGQVIGYVGATGNATGPHLHFEIRNGIRNPF